ncbi:MAG: hypothetical protein Q8R53_02310 [Nanoarchaeota archaeon]|nr:hypothetical protein [Nanoarchaeota archaeon]
MVQWSWEIIGKIVLAVVGGVVLIALLFPGFEPVKSVMQDIVGFTLSFIGAEELPHRLEAPIQQEQRQALERLQQVARSVVQARVDPSLGGCFANYYRLPPPRGDSFSGFPNLGGDTSQQLSVELIFDDGGTADDQDDDQTEVIVSGGPGGGQYLEEESFILEKIRPCVIAGEARSADGVLPAEKFHQRFLYDLAVPQPPIVELYPYHFTPVDSIRFTWLNEDNAIRWSPAGNVEIDEQNNLEDGGWMYTPDSYHLCFFPTLDNFFDAPTNEEGIRGYFISRSRWTNSLSWQGQRYLLNLCEPPQYEMVSGVLYGQEITADWDSYRIHYRYNREEERWESRLESEEEWSFVRPQTVRGRERPIPTRLASLNEVAGYDLFYEITTRIIPAALNPNSEYHDAWLEDYDMIQSIENLPQRIAYLPGSCVGNLAECHEGVSPAVDDPRQSSLAIQLLVENCDSGYAESCRFLAHYYWPDDRMKDTARVYYAQACDLGHVEACEEFANQWLNYYHNNEQARVYYERACTGERQTACDQLAALAP